jgi:hypothetical protein
MKTLTALTLLCTALLLGGCSSFPDKLAKYDALGIEYAEVTGKWSHTVYQRSEDNGEIRSELQHNNPWIPKVHIIRRRPAAQD